MNSVKELMIGCSKVLFVLSLNALKEEDLISCGIEFQILTLLCFYNYAIFMLSNYIVYCFTYLNRVTNMKYEKYKND